MKHFITSIWFLGLILAIPTIILIPDIFSKYITTLESTTIPEKGENAIYFKDLNGDGFKEKIICFKNTYNQLSFQYFNKKGGILNQLNFKYDYYPSLDKIYFGDVNKNHLLEVYGFTVKHDSLYLGWVEPYPNQNKIYNNKFISKIGTFENGKMNFSIVHFEITDLDKDGRNEVLFSIESGYSLSPRIIVLFQPDDGTMIQSIDTGINAYHLVINDLDNDGKSEIVASNATSWNLVNENGEPIVDNKPWLRVFDCRLNYFFKAIPFSKGLKNYLESFVINTENNEKKIVVFQTNTSLPTRKIFSAYHFDIHGNLMDSVYLPELGNQFHFKIYQEKNGFIVYNGEKIVWLSNNFKIENQRKIQSSLHIYKINSINALGLKYYAINATKNQLILFANQFNQLATVFLGSESIPEVIFDTNKPQNYFFVHTNQNDYFYRIQKNKFYYLKFPFYAAIYLISVLFIWFVQLIREKQLNEKFELKNQIREMELKSLNNQMNPHFMFNSFTTIALLLKKGKQKNAYDVFMKFTKLVRSNLEFANHLLRPLKEELNVVTNFLEINTLRFKDKLEYTINIDDTVSQNISIPKMMLQIHVENALKHGIAISSRPGKIKIKIDREDNFIRFVIEDNGVGRQRARAMKTFGTQKGLPMLQAIYERLNKTNTLQISQHFADLLDESGKPTGTQVEILVPVELKE